MLPAANYPLSHGQIWCHASVHPYHIISKFAFTFWLTIVYISIVISTFRWTKNFSCNLISSQFFLTVFYKIIKSILFLFLSYHFFLLFNHNSHFQEQEMEKQQLLSEQSRLSERGAAEMILLYISATKGNFCFLIHFKRSLIYVGFS